MRENTQENSTEQPRSFMDVLKEDYSTITLLIQYIHYELEELDKL